MDILIHTGESQIGKPIIIVGFYIVNKREIMNK